MVSKLLKLRFSVQTSTGAIEARAPPFDVEVLLTDFQMPVENLYRSAAKFYREMDSSGQYVYFHLFIYSIGLSLRNELSERSSTLEQSWNVRWTTGLKKDKTNECNLCLDYVMEIFDSAEVQSAMCFAFPSPTQPRDSNKKETLIEEFILLNLWEHQ
ncbi:hypothetical protein QR680_013562 [Steinernema hermaphroditum]|uniref:Uncharacterized protein n=1 Tax=Steinernema hermaphroditum TaxID=289476 RepID=A0AA39I5Y6_9BILA|nr:hypothetical protein QR680_013562 [Steinernema hermaphroditum]